MRGVRQHVKRLGFTEELLADRLRYFRISEQDLLRLAGLRELAAQVTERVVEQFYEHLLGYEETRQYLSDPNLVRRLRKKQTRYFMELFDGRLDLDYVEDRLLVGAVHERLGIPPRWYIGAYSRYLSLLRGELHAHLTPDEALEAYGCLERLMHLDASLALDAYIAAHVETSQRQQVAIRELSTPVIRVYERVLLLPLVGVIDSHRAQQIMQSVLQRISTEQAKVLLLDIAGVGVVDTQVADHLLKTTAAARLLGASVILTGISPQVARTVVELGVDITGMHTRNQLADGLELALAIVGKRIAPRTA